MSLSILSKDTSKRTFFQCIDTAILDKIMNDARIKEDDTKTSDLELIEELLPGLKKYDSNSIISYSIPKIEENCFRAMDWLKKLLNDKAIHKVPMEDLFKVILISMRKVIKTTP